MAADGLVLITIVLAEGMLAHPPVIFTRGFAGTEENSRIQDMIEQSAMSQLDQLLRGQSSKADIAAQLKRQIANLIFRSSRRNPLVEIQIMDV
jgi:mRNA degradation ribonuclease J1/J2